MVSAREEISRNFFSIPVYKKYFKKLPDASDIKKYKGVPGVFREPDGKVYDSDVKRVIIEERSGICGSIYFIANAI